MGQRRSPAKVYLSEWKETAEGARKHTESTLVSVCVFLIQHGIDTRPETAINDCDSIRPTGSDDETDVNIK